jgi:hypothetical protein
MICGRGFGFMVTWVTGDGGVTEAILTLPVLELTFFFRVVEMGENVWQISPEMAGITDKNLARIAKACHKLIHNPFRINFYRSADLRSV